MHEAAMFDFEVMVGEVLHIFQLKKGGGADPEEQNSDFSVQMKQSVRSVSQQSGQSLTFSTAASSLSECAFL